MRSSRWLWVAAGAIVAITVVGQLLVPFAHHAEDMRRLLAGASSLITGRPPGELLLVYPASSAVQYVPLALLPRGVTEIALRIACVVMLTWIVAGFARDDRGRVQPWALLLLLSPPVIDVIRLDQFNTALALFTLVIANRLLASRRPLLAGLAAEFPCRVRLLLPRSSPAWWAARTAERSAWRSAPSSSWA